MYSGLLVPDTVDYMIAGYAVLAIIISAYLVSILLRWRKTKREYKHLQEQ
jgi:hypothetical protein